MHLERIRQTSRLPVHYRQFVMSSIRNIVLHIETVKMSGIRKRFEEIVIVKGKKVDGIDLTCFSFPSMTFHHIIFILSANLVWLIVFEAREGEGESLRRSHNNVHQKSNYLLEAGKTTLFLTWVKGRLWKA